MIRAAYDWTIAQAGRRNALPALAVVSFIESSVFPIPPDVMIIPMILARPDRAFLIATVALVASVLGGLAGYLIGWGLYETLGQWIVSLYGAEDAVATFSEEYNRRGAWIVIAGGMTPLPYKVITILSGATGLNLGLFMVSSVIARGVRFFALAVLLWRFGPAMRRFIERWLNLLLTATLVLIVAGFYALRYL